MSYGSGRGPDAASVEATENTTTIEKATSQSADLIAQYTDVHSNPTAILRLSVDPVDGSSSPDWAGRVAAVEQWLPCASRRELEQFAVTQFNRAEIGWLAMLQGISDPEMIAQRDASYAIADALDWAAESRRPSHAELVERRSVGAVTR